MKKLAILGVVALLLATGVAAAATTVTVYQDETTFLTDTGAAPLPFPADADTALPSKPFASWLVGYSCTDGSTGIDLAGLVTIKEAVLPDWICFIDQDWNAGSGNTNPTPTSPTIVANGEDDYVLVDFANPVYAVGFELLTNFAANETITLTFADSTTLPVLDAALGTSANTFEFVGFKSDAPIVSVTIDTTGGASQNEGIAGIWATFKIDIDIKPGSDPNSINLCSRGVVPIAILSGDGFDATTIDPTTVEFAGASVRVKGKGALQYSHEDVDADGDLDFVAQIEVENLDLGEGATEAVVTGSTYDGLAVEGRDSVNIVKYCGE